MKAEQQTLAFVNVTMRVFRSNAWTCERIIESASTRRRANAITTANILKVTQENDMVKVGLSGSGCATNIDLNDAVQTVQNALPKYK